MKSSIQPGWSPLEVMLGRWPDGGGPVILTEGKKVSTRELRFAARSVASRLLADGLESGDHVLLLMRNSAEYLAAALGVMFAGGTVVPVNARFTSSEISQFFRHGRPRAWIAEPKYAERMRAAEGAHGPDVRYEVDLSSTSPLSQLVEWADPGDGSRPVAELRDRDIAAMFFTAGTTGSPKGACTSHSAITGFTDVVAHAMELSDRDTVLLPMPMFYTGGLKAPLAVLSSGADLAIFRDWKPADLVAAMAQHKGTLLWAVPSVWALMIRSQGFDPEFVQSLRIMWRGGSLTPRKIIEELKEIFPGLPHYQSYGLTECNMAAMERDSTAHDESCGFPTYGTEVTIEGERIREEPGEIWVRGTQQFSYYFNDPERTAKTIVDGWVRTGDQGWITPDGRLRVIGRGSDIVIRGGENISTAEIERIIMNLEGVEETAVIGVPDDVFGQELKAVVVSTSHQVTEAGVRRACEETLAEFKVPKYIEVRSEPLPKSSVGKIQKGRIS